MLLNITCSRKVCRLSTGATYSSLFLIWNVTYSNINVLQWDNSDRFNNKIQIALVSALLYYSYNRLSVRYHRLLAGYRWSITGYYTIEIHLRCNAALPCKNNTWYGYTSNYLHFSLYGKVKKVYMTIFMTLGQRRIDLCCWLIMLLFYLILSAKGTGKGF